MRPTAYLVIPAAVIAASLAVSPIHAQPPEDNAAPPPVEQGTAEPAQPGAAPSADGVIRKWGPSEPVVQAAPAPAQDYPPCTRGKRDSCSNPDPRKESDTKAAWKSGN